MTSSWRAPMVDDGLLTRWRPWITAAARRFGATGYGALATASTFEQIVALARAPGLLHASAVERDDGRRGLVLVERSSWETSVLSHAVAKVAWLAADDFATATMLASASLAAARAARVVLLSAAPGHSPAYVHVALTEAGFHVGSQVHTVWSDIEQNAPAVLAIPIRGAFRDATPADADAVAELAYFGFDDQRLARDPLFPRSWGRRLYAAWARNLVLGAADAVVVAESRGRIVGFVSMTADAAKRARVPPLLAVDRGHAGRGTGAMLVRIMFEWYRDRGVTVLVGGTEKSSRSINALYLKLGGSVIDSNIVYHATPGLGDAPDQIPFPPSDE